MRRRALWPLLALPALWLAEVPLDPFQADLPAGGRHLLGTDSLGRDALARLALAATRSLGFASLIALGALALGAGFALGRGGFQPARGALRSVPALLLLIPLAALGGGLPWVPLGLLLAGLQALHLEPSLRARLGPFRRSPAWAYGRILGAPWTHQVRVWAPWALEEALPLFPTAWIGALWGEATLRLLGLGPGPHHDSLGLLLQEELPRLATDPRPLGWASLAIVLALAWLSTPEPTP